MTFLIGSSPRTPCPVCDVSPVAFRPVDGQPQFAECARCGLWYVLPPRENPRGEATCAVDPVMVSVFRTYFQLTGNRVGPPPGADAVLETLSPEDQERAARFRDWVEANPDNVAAHLSPRWSHLSFTAVVIEQDGANRWVIVGATQVGNIMVPLDADAFPAGTIFTISVPASETVKPTIAAPEKPDDAPK